MTAGTCAAAGLVLLTALVAPTVAVADVIHLKNGSRIEVEAWRDLGDAIEFARGGGLVRISKADVARIEGTPVRGPLSMYPSAPAEPAGGPAAPGLERAAAAGRMLELLGQGEALLGRDLMAPDEKAGAFRRLAAAWQGFVVPKELDEAYSKGQQALQTGVEVFNAQDAGSEVGPRVEALRKEFRETQEKVKTIAEGKGED